jgi:hypothetical protein
VKNVFKVFADQCSQRIGIGPFPEDFSYRCHLHPGESTGSDETEVIHVRGPVEGEPMKGYPPPDRKTDGGYFLITNPHPSIDGLSAGLDSQVPTDTDNDFFYGKDKAGEILSVVCQSKDRITDNLSGSVISDVASSFHKKDLNVFLPKLFVWNQYIRLFASPTQSNNGQMLQKEQRIRETSFDLFGQDPSLEGECFLVGEEAIIGHIDFSPKHLTPPSDQSVSPSGFPQARGFLTLTW